MEVYMVNYSANELVELAVQIEKRGYAYYDEALKRKGLTPKAAELFILLRDQEKKHEQFFLSLRNESDHLELDESNDWDSVSSFLRSMTDCWVFDCPEAALAKAKDATDVEELIDNALSFEKDTLLFFKSLQDVIVDEHKVSLLDAIINEEIMHINKLTQFKNQL